MTFVREGLKVEPCPENSVHIEVVGVGYEVCPPLVEGESFVKLGQKIVIIAEVLIDAIIAVIVDPVVDLLIYGAIAVVVDAVAMDVRAWGSPVISPTHEHMPIFVTERPPGPSVNPMNANELDDEVAGGVRDAAVIYGHLNINGFRGIETCVLLEPIREGVALPCEVKRGPGGLLSIDEDLDPLIHLINIVLHAHESVRRAQDPRVPHVEAFILRPHVNVDGGGNAQLEGECEPSALACELRLVVMDDNLRVGRGFESGPGFVQQTHDALYGDER